MNSIHIIALSLCYDNFSYNVEKKRQMQRHITEPLWVTSSVSDVTVGSFPTLHIRFT